METPAPLPPVEAVHVEPPAAHRIQPPAPKAPAPEPPAVEPAVASAPGVLQEFVSDLESSLGDSFLPGAVPHEPAHAVEATSTHAAQPQHTAQPELEPVGNATPTTFGVPQNEVIGEFVADLEASLGDDFLKDAPVPEPVPAPQAQPVQESKPPVAAAPAQQFQPRSDRASQHSRRRQRRSRLCIRRRASNFLPNLSPSPTAIGSCRSRGSGSSNHPRPTHRRQVFPLRRRCRR